MGFRNDTFLNTLENRTTNTDSNLRHLFVSPLILFFTSFVTLVILVFNGLVLFTLLKKKTLRKHQRIEFILWLCLSDLVVGVAGIIFTITYCFESLTSSLPVCITKYHAICAGIVQTLAQVFLVCLDRYLVLTKNYLYQNFKRKYRYFLIIGTTIFVHLYILVPREILRSDVTVITYCSLEQLFGHNMSTYLMITSFLCVPLLFGTILLYAIILATFRKCIRQTHNQPQVSVISNYRIDSDAVPVYPSRNIALTNITSTMLITHKHEFQVIVTIGIIIVFLVLLCVPLVVIIFIEGLDVSNILNRKYRIIATGALVLNSAVNPILYAWRIKRFRQELLNICMCR